PIVAVSSVSGAGLDDLRRAIVQSVGEVEDRDATTRVFRLPIDRAFTMKGFGSVITGTTYSGRLSVDSEVEVLPGGDRSRARNIQVHGEARDAAAAGERTSINLADIPLDRLHRGQQVVTPHTLRTSQVITARLDLLAEAKPLKEQTRIRFHHLASELLGNIRFIDDTKDERRWIHFDVLADFRRRSMEFLQRYFQQHRTAIHVPKGEFVQKLIPHGADGALTNFLLQDLAREKIVQIEGDALDVPGRSKKL